MKNITFIFTKPHLTFFILVFFAQVSWSQDFTVTYSGPDTILVDNNCEELLYWGHPYSLSVFSNDPLCELESLTLISIEDDEGNFYPVSTIPPNAPFQHGDMVTITYAATDVCTQTLFISFEVWFVDLIAPMWTSVPQPLTLECDGTFDPSGQISDWLNNNGGGVATEGCDGGGVTYTHDYTGLTNVFCGATGSTNVTFTATDQLGNSNHWTVNLTIEDTAPPVWIYDPVDITIDLDNVVDASAALTNWLETVGIAGDATDNCGSIAEFSHNFSGFDSGCDFGGTATVTFKAIDICGNTSTRDATVTLVDNFAPSVICQPVTIYVNPLGDDYILNPTEVDGGSFDNCSINLMSVYPYSFSCDDVGTTQNVTLQVTDPSGNTASCVTQVTIEADSPNNSLSPTFSIGLCGNSDLNLFANATGNTYQWTGPNGFISSEQNPIIPNADPSFAGTYTLQVAGQGGCQLTGSVSVLIGTAPNTPSIQVVQSEICSNQEIEISTQSYSGDVINYMWYEGISPSGNLVGTSSIPTFSISNSTSGNYTYYVMVEVNGCMSNPSEAIGVEVNESPMIVSISNTQIDCASGDEDMILTPSFSTNDNYTYEWTGPNGFFSTAMEATLPDVSSADNGSYTLTIFNDEGCASTTYTQVISVDDLPMTPTITSLDNQLCAGEFLQIQLVNNPYIGANISYEWNLPDGSILTTPTASLTIENATATQSGNYSVSVTVDGCTSKLSGDFAIEISEAPAAPIADYNGPFCEGSTLQLMTDFIPGASYSWTGPNNFNSTQQNPLIFPADQTDEGTYFLSVMINGCPSPSSAPLFVQVIESPSSVIALNSGVVCLGNSNAELELMVAPTTAIADATYTWYDAMTHEVVAGPTNDLSATVSDLTNYGSGTHEFYVVASVSGCTSASSEPTAVTFNEIPLNSAFAGEDIFVCDNNSIMLNAQAPTIGSGQWIQTSGTTITIVNPDQATTSIVGLEAGETYTFAWSLSNGSCIGFSVDEVTVTIDEAVMAADAGTDFQLCDGNTTNLNATPITNGITGTWSQPTAQEFMGVSIEDMNDPNTSVSGLMAGNTYQFIWTLSNNGCGDFDSDVVVVAIGGTSGATAFAGNDKTECGIEETTLEAIAAPSGSVGTWTTSTPDVEIIAPTLNNSFVTNLQPGENIFTWTLSNPVCGEFSTDVVVIYFEPSPITVDDIYNINYDGSLELRAMDNDEIFGSYTITYDEPSNGILTFDGDKFEYTSNVTFVGTDQFTYEICSEICPDECSKGVVTLQVGDDATCAIPTIFSPNNDGVNDEFIVPCLSTDQYPNHLVSIFNEWGDEVFRTTHYENNWIGTYRGQDLPVGTYFYIVDLGNGSKPNSGFLKLER